MSDEEAGEIKLPSKSDEPRSPRRRVRYVHAFSARLSATWMPCFFFQAELPLELT